MIAFEKYHGLGNDYLVVDDRAGRGLTGSEVKRICDRSLGVGSDGILLRVADPQGDGQGDGKGGGNGDEEGDFRIRIFNPDGSEAEKSGNGLRIFARYLFDRGEVGDAAFPVHTPGGRVECRVLDAGRAVRVEMGRVSFSSEEIPVAGPPREVLRESLEVDGATLEYSAATIGNPHCVVFRDEICEEDVLRLGPLIECDPRFPNRTNVQLAQVLARDRLAIEIWERGAGHTRASGSSSCAAAAVAHRLGVCDASISVEMPGGALAVEIDRDFGVVQQGPVVHVASGTLHPEAFGA
jgi:diaminopimelate epimerase